MLFLLDSSVPGALESWLRGLGHDAISAAAASTPDAILAMAAKEQRILLTSDQALLDPERVAAGVVYLNLPGGRESELTERLEELLKRDPPCIGPGWAVFVERGHDRIFKIPAK